MDVDTSEAIEGLRSEMRHGDETLRGDLRRVESTLGVRIDGVESSLLAEMRELRAEMREIRDDTKRHTSVLFESLRDDIRMIAEAAVSLDAKFGSLDAKLGSLDAKVEAIGRPNDFT